MKTKRMTTRQLKRAYRAVWWDLENEWDYQCFDELSERRGNAAKRRERKWRVRK